GPGDLDLTTYSLRKYARLAAAGNPTILLLLFIPREHLLVQTPLGEELQHLAPAFASQRAVAKFLGYMNNQRERLGGSRGQMRVNRPAASPCASATFQCEKFSTRSPSSNTPHDRRLERGQCARLEPDGPGVRSRT